MNTAVTIPALHILRAAIVVRWCGEARIRLRYTGPGFDGRASYAGAISFPDGRRWPFRNLCPSVCSVPGPQGLHVQSADAFDRAAAFAASVCGWRDTRDKESEGYHDETLSDALYDYGRHRDKGSWTAYSISRKKHGRCTFSGT